MSLDSIDKLFKNTTLWIVFSIVAVGYYLYPLLHPVFYVPTFDNLDSNVVWYKILTESGHIFSPNNTIIPNMMSGLPRSSYPGEFDILLWLYYFFEPQTAYVINEVIIHITAFFSMFLFLNRYVIVQKNEGRLISVFIGSLYFTLLPYWSGAGLSIAVVPLVTYTLLNIKNNTYTRWDWILLALLPLYTSFIFFYMFYIILAGFYLLWDTYRNRTLNGRFMLALVLMGVVFLLKEYRLIITMFFDSSFVSHRTEFNIFFKKDFLDFFRSAHLFFLNGHESHASGLQMPYVLPVIIFSFFASFIKTEKEKKLSMILIAFLMASTLTKDLWNMLLTELYSLPVLLIILLTMFLFIDKAYKLYLFLLITTILFSFLAASFEYKGVKAIVDILPILKSLNFTRIAFIQPFIWGILLTVAIQILFQKLRYTSFFAFTLIVVQFFHSLNASFYSIEDRPRYASFKSYYAPELFEKVKQAIPEDIRSIRVASYGIEPAVLLFNGFYTIDGYIPNYPLSYKHKFRPVIQPYLEQNTSLAKYARFLYDDWGSKVYLMESTLTIGIQFYDKNQVITKPQFNSDALCTFNVSYLISSHKIENPSVKNLTLIKSFKGDSNSWDIYLYKTDCKTD